MNHILKNTRGSLASAAALVTLSILGGNSAQAQTTTLTITLGSQETFWADANKCNAQGPRAAWLSFIIKNTGANTATNVTATLAGFTGTNATYFSAPSDLTRQFTTIAAGAQEPIYFYVDYSEVCNHPGNGNKYEGYTANYTLTVTASNATTVTRNGTVLTGDLLTANAAGIANSNVIGAGLYVGQLLTQKVTYSFGNNTDLFFQPAGEAGFDAACIRLIGSEITGTTGTVTTPQVKDQLWFPTANVPAGGGTIDLTYTWEIVCTNQQQTLSPWAAAKSGQKYKYQGFSSTANYVPAAQAITVTKSASPSSMADNTGGPVTWTVTFSNAGTVPVRLAQITDVVPSCMTIANAFASGSQVTATNTSNTPGTSGTVSWIGYDLGDSPSSTYYVPGSGTLTLKYTTNVTGCASNQTYTNSATGKVGTTTVGPATATVSIGSSADLQITKTDGVTTYSPGGTVTYTIVATNAGPSAVTGATISDTMPSGVTATWTAVGAGGATGFATSGSGSIAATANMPVGSTITYTVTANIASNRSGALTNTASIATPSGITDPTPGNNSATDTDTQSSSSDLSIVKDDGVTTYTPGSSVTYTITVRNLGPSDVTGATVTDTMPSGITANWTATSSTGATGFAASGSGNIAHTVNMPSGSSIIYTVTANIAADRTGDLVNTATVATPSGVPDPTPGNNSSTDTDTAAPRSDLSITKDDGASTYTPGTNVTYTITVTNAGPSVATGATVADALPSGITTASWTSTGTTGGASVTAGNSGSGALNSTVTMPVGSTVTYTMTLTVPSTFTGTLTNTATTAVPSGYTDPTPENNTATDSDNPDPKADLSITKNDGSATYTPGTNVTYTITVTNAGPSAVTGATVADALPSGITTASWTSTGTTGGASVTAGNSGSGALNSTATIPVGGSVTYTMTLTVPSTFTGTLTNTATTAVPSGYTDPTPENNTATDSDNPDPKADLSITKNDGSTSYTPGSNVTYTITVTNAGPSAVTGATVADALPSGITTASWTSTGTTGGASVTAGSSGSGALNSTATIPVGGTVTYTMTLTVPADFAGDASGNLVNTATTAVPSGYTDPTPGNNSATDTDAKDLRADLQILKTDGASTYTKGTNVTYTITVTNNGPSAVTGATVADALPLGISSATWSATGTTGGASVTAGNSGTGALASTVTMPVGSTVTYSITLTVPSNFTGDASGNLVNTATVGVPSGYTDPTPGNNSSTDTDLPNTADLVITKTDGSATYTPGTTVTYTITVTNVGPNAVSGATITDNPPFTSGTTWSAIVGGGASFNTASSGSGAISSSVNIPVGGIITYILQMPVPITAAGPLSNTATVSTPPGVTDPTPLNNTATDLDTFLGNADLALTKNDNAKTYVPGTIVTYTIGVTNMGPTVATAFNVTDTLPAGTTVSGALPSGCSESAGVVTCSAAGLGIGASASWTIAIQTPANGACLSNTATITGATTPDPNPANNSATDLNSVVGTSVNSAGLGLVLGYPTFAGNNTVTGATAYNATTKLFKLDSTAATFLFAAGSTTRVVTSGTLAIRANVANNGALMGGVTGNDFTLNGTVTDNLGNTFTGPLLTGEVIAFGFKELGTTDRFELRFVVTGGSLAGKYTGKDLGVVITAEASTFTGSFATSFSSRGKFSAGALTQLCAIN